MLKKIESYLKGFILLGFFMSRIIVFFWMFYVILSIGKFFSGLISLKKDYLLNGGLFVRSIEGLLLVGV